MTASRPLSNKPQQFRPDIILMSTWECRLNGYEATRRIRELPWGRSVTIIALTGWGQDADRTKSRDAGFDNHLVKPVDFAELENLLVELKSGRERMSPDQETTASH